ncbi:MAG: YebC/PmpR family DNA-binding transcriptional regulator [Christensenellaceae bacterium]
MSGHSKWATMHRKKEKIDAARGKIFTRIGRELAVAVRMGGPDPNSNAKLRDVIAKAKANNIPNDNITRIIKKSSDSDSAAYEEVIYEGYAPGGVAVIVECTTDNRNRTAADMRHYFDKNGGSLGASGCVGWMFDRKGVIDIEKTDDMDEDEVMMMALDAGADDFSDEGDYFEVLTDPNALNEVSDALQQAGYTLANSEVERIPQNTVSITAEDAAKLNKMLDMMDENDDVQYVFHNADMPEEDE